MNVLSRISFALLAPSMFALVGCDRKTVPSVPAPEVLVIEEPAAFGTQRSPSNRSVDRTHLFGPAGMRVGAGCL